MTTHIDTDAHTTVDDRGRGRRGAAVQGQAVPGPAEPRAGRTQWIALVVLMLPVLLVSVDNTVLNVALPAISKSLEPSGAGLLWIVDIYPLVLAGLLVSMGSLADRIGRRRLLMIGSVGFALVSVFAAFAPTTEMLILARALLGVFGAMLMPSTLSLLRSLFVNRDQRRLAIAVWASAFGAGSALGPIVGGVMLANWWWGSVFLIAVPVLVPLVFLTPILIPESKDPQPGRIDGVSILASFAAMAPVVYGIKSLATEGINLIGVLAVAIGIAAGVWFVRRQLHRPDPMLDVRLFGRAAFSGAVMVNLLSVVALVGGLFFVAQHLQLVLGQDPIEAGLTLLPGSVAMIVAGLVIVPIARRVRASIVVPIGLLISASGYAAIALMAGNLSALTLVIAFIALGVGIGAAETVSNEIILSAAPADKAGAASAISETAYEFGAVLGTAILGTMITAAYRAAIVLPPGLPANDANAAGETIGGAAAVADGLPSIQAEALMESARHAFDSGVGITAWIGVALVLAAAVIAALTLGRASEDSAQGTDASAQIEQTA